MGQLTCMKCFRWGQSFKSPVHSLQWCCHTARWQCLALPLQPRSNPSGPAAKPSPAQQQQLLSIMPIAQPGCPALAAQARQPRLSQQTGTSEHRDSPGLSVASKGDLRTSCYILQWKDRYWIGQFAALNLGEPAGTVISSFIEYNEGTKRTLGPSVNHSIVSYHKMISFIKWGMRLRNDSLLTSLFSIFSTIQGNNVDSWKAKRQLL